MGSSLVFFDIETAGLRPVDPTIQLAAIAVGPDWREIETYERKIAFDPRGADPKALELNHFDAAVWKRDAVPERQAVEEFGALLNRHRSVELVSKRTGRPYTVARLAGHNAASFDLDRVAAAFKRFDIFFAVDFRSVLDTRHGAVWFFETHPELPKPADYKLGTLAAYFGIEADGAHDALVDVRLSAGIARAISDPQRWREVA
jgi:DNA polymerase III epsilon subunit-like protein